MPQIRNSLILKLKYSHIVQKHKIEIKMIPIVLINRFLIHNQCSSKVKKDLIIIYKDHKALIILDLNQLIPLFQFNPKEQPNKIKRILMFMEEI